MVRANRLATDCAVAAACRLHPENGTTPLILAASLGNVEGLKLLLERDADPQLRDWERKTALDYAVVAKKRDSARLLQSINRHR